MLKNISQLECKVGDKVYRLLCETDSTIPDVKEALCQFLKYVGQIEDSIKEAKEKKEKEEKVEECCKE